MTGRLRRILIHIGCHKTGSTSIQDFAVQDTTVLPSAGVYYPRGLFKEFPDQHSQLYWLISRRRPEPVNEVFARMSADAAAAGAHTLFLSGEDLCAADPQALQLLAEVADRHFEEKSFAIVVRNPRDYALSQFKHRLRHAEPLTEVGFYQDKPISGHRALENWRRNFSENAVVLIYDQIADDLIAAFYRATLGLGVQDRRRSNVSQDFLTLAIHNAFLKEWLSPEIEAIHWEVAKRFPGPMRFAIEDLVGRDLSRDAVEDWKLTGAPPAAIAARAGHDPVEVCEKMLLMFTRLRDHFRQLEAARNAPPPAQT